MATLNVFKILICAAALVIPEAHAKVKKAPLCGGKQATSTVYNLPVENKEETWKKSKDLPWGFSSFKAAVKMQGSGKRTNGNIARYKGGDVKADPMCTTTKTSSSGQCLLPYFSIAADVKNGWKMGDIIYMRNVADQEITLPSGRKIRHPGFFIVHDVGGAIKGANRFDFFVGGVAPAKSEFEKFKMGSAGSCENKEFEKVDRGSAKYRDALAQIYNNQDSDKTKGGTGGDGPENEVLASRSSK